MSTTFVSRSVVLAVFLAGCGGNKPPVTAPDTTAMADAGPSTPANPVATTAPTATPDTPDAPDAAPPPVTGSTKVTKKSDPAWATCHSSYHAKGKEVAGDVGKMAAGCAALTKMKQVGATIKGKQADSNPPASYKLKATAGHCYRVYAQADNGIKDLDLLLKDSTGQVGAEDSTDDPSPVLFEDGAICFKDADDATIVVSVGQGKGSYALQIWGD